MLSISDSASMSEGGREGGRVSSKRAKQKLFREGRLTLRVMAKECVGCSSYRRCCDERSLSGVTLTFSPNIRSQEDDEDLHEDPHEYLKLWTH